MSESGKQNDENTQLQSKEICCFLFSQLFSTAFPVRHKKITASAGNRTRVNCLEGSYAHHYTTDAMLTNIEAGR